MSESSDSVQDDFVQAYKVIEEQRRKREAEAADALNDAILAICKRYDVEMKIMFIGKADGNTFQIAFDARH